MVLSTTLQSALLRHQRSIDAALRSTLQKVAGATGIAALDAYYGQMQYHLGWVDANLILTRSNPGKLLRPTLLLLAYEAAGAWELAKDATSPESYLQRALSAAVAIELTHNFTLIHDDIEDGDTERRHRPTLWNIWGVPQAINTGDGMFGLARFALWGVLENGVEGDIAAHLGSVLDRTVLEIAEGQYLDISFEQRQDISVSMYLDMIGRKTAALMRCAAEMGAMLGTRDQSTIQRLASFGQAIGIAFQVRDDVLGVWATSEELGKTQAGDIYRRKKSLPILHALEHANSQDLQILQTIYSQETPMDSEQATQVLAILARTQTQAYCRTFLQQQCQTAYEALDAVSDPTTNTSLSSRAIGDMKVMIQFVETAAY
ncbi:polyprenyl synthetase family protein [Dictyobacter arantiisoli]|uniref:Polyprenyl synthetase n=1 Tax=Dictyobacter arantiisoli TaxID=2014874 RepID=A0A5A5T9J9_9CHLR|nr:polyprenyl synthetase family protein [Dictyobacter arantiisoli]GCF07836.1 polyprenyl synthetase [Dictyobacter arantiisoli]